MGNMTSCLYVTNQLGNLGFHSYKNCSHTCQPQWSFLTVELAQQPAAHFLTAGEHIIISKSLKLAIRCRIFYLSHKQILFTCYINGKLHRDFNHWETPYLHKWKIMIIFHMHLRSPIICWHVTPSQSTKCHEMNGNACILFLTIIN